MRRMHNHAIFEKVNMILMHFRTAPVILAGLLILPFLMTGCSVGKGKEGFRVTVYDIDRENTKLVSEEYVLPLDDGSFDNYTSECVGRLLNRMISGGENVANVGAIGREVGDVVYRIDGDVATIDFGQAYYNSVISRRVLQRAAVVDTLCQLEDIKGVAFTVNGEPIMDTNGQTIGVMTEDSFIDNDGAKVNAYERVTLQLYFVNEAGDSLVSEVDDVMYGGNVSMERFVMENLLKGPQNAGAYPAINPECKILNVTTKDDICYINLSSAFLTKTTNATDEVILYSIVNSLTSLTGINKVQIMIDGETEVSFGTFYLATPFEAKHSLTE